MTAPDPSELGPGWLTALTAEAVVSTGSADYGRVNCVLLGASNPTHWRAIAAMFRTHLTEHTNAWGDLTDHRCREVFIPCRMLLADCDLAELIVQQLAGLG